MKRTQAGATLVELVLVIALTAIIVSFGVSFIAAPVQTLELNAGRDALAAEVEQAAGMVREDLRRALPGSLRFRSSGGVLAIELLRVADQVNAVPDALAANAAQRFDIGLPETSFETLGTFPATPLPLNTRQMYLAVRDPLTPGANVYGGNGRISPRGTRLRAVAGSEPGRMRVTLNPGVTFAVPGALRRVFLLSGPVSLLCDPRTGTLRRYSGYAMTSNQAQRDSDAELMAAGASRALLANDVTSCRFNAPTVAAAAQSLGTLAVRLQRGNESTALMQMMVITDEG